MVPGWGADGTGVGKLRGDGTPLWFSLSSGGNYMSMSAVHDGKRTWVLGGKSFGGQTDVFDADGLRYTTSNWSWPTHYQIGFVDIRCGVRAYLRPDGKVGAYVEDDGIGRLARLRMDGAETVKKQTSAFQWESAEVTAGLVPLSDRVAGPGLARLQTIPRVAELKVDGDWSQWHQHGVTPQVIALPSSVGFKRMMADDLLRTFREGTLIGAVVHDGAHLYAYFLVADDTQHFDAGKLEDLWRYDGIELWIEEEQFGLSLLKDGTPALYKWRHHNRTGQPFKANYPLPRENIWAARGLDCSYIGGRTRRATSRRRGR
jgi:hypothetical protein